MRTTNRPGWCLHGRVATNARRLLLAALLAIPVACGPSENQPDAAADGGDAPPQVDAPVDAPDRPLDGPPDAPIPDAGPLDLIDIIDLGGPLPDATDADPVLSDPGELACGPAGFAWPGVSLLAERQSTTIGVASGHDSYPCGDEPPLTTSGEDGGERVFHFRSDVERDVRIKLSLENGCGPMEHLCPIWAFGPQPRMVDLDLFVLTAPPGAASAGACVAASARRSLQDESVTFQAHVGQDYWVVVDGPAAGAGTFLLAGDCGTCLLPAATLACNQTMLANTATRALSTTGRYSCQRRISAGDPPESVDGQAGFEDTYDLRSGFDPESRVDNSTNYTVRLTGLSQDLNLFVVEDDGTRCGDLRCLDRSATAGNVDEVVRFSSRANLYESRPPRLVVDGPRAGGAPYQLEVACAPSCATAERLSCGWQNGGTHLPFPAQVDSWGSCATGLTGPEQVYDLGKLAAGPYTVLMTGLSANLDLVLLRSRVNAFECDPTTPCVASSSNPGLADERLTFQADGTSTYALAADGRAGAESSFQIALFGEACAPLACSATEGILHLGCGQPRDYRRNDEANHATPPLDGYGCAPDATGAQMIYNIGVQRDATYTVVLDQLTANLDLVELGCLYGTEPMRPKRCSANPGTQAETLTFDTGSRDGVRVAVVGKAGAVGSYRLQLQGPPCQEGHCNAQYFEPMSCPDRFVLDSEESAGRVGVRNVDRWSCTDATPGPEAGVLVRLTRTTTLTARLDGSHPELELLVVEGEAFVARCRTSTPCLAHRLPPGPGPAEVTFQGEAGHDYYIMVDSIDDQAPPWQLTVDATCP